MAVTKILSPRLQDKADLRSAEPTSQNARREISSRVSRTGARDAGSTESYLTSQPARGYPSSFRQKDNAIRAKNQGYFVSMKRVENFQIQGAGKLTRRRT
ncbi:MAG: hypothetical protein UY77_C0013G0002 [Candidatus Uhrbacteria bacterium GW2011_GWA2_53_10]|uniref:Uncharacterized protein n=1 Tax=Candidatus Uhrbacteria bacterium GW2011_GWA2_53_10 TaxID=1618980 RepID=A0A0G2AJM5_9BACT|nr:MAG: hypothetical protein UY77_C0013G0002 [Candidatus Uhrbacteria bacterium GW2011_GWA2_53_10]